MSAHLSNRKPGRPRSQQADEAILNAARELMLEFGAYSFSMDTLAVRAGVSKPTIYRRWETKEALITDAFGFASQQTEVPDTGSALTDLQQLLGSMLAALGERFGIHSSSAHRMLAGMLDQRQFIEQYKDGFIASRRAAYKQIIRRGKQRGEIREDADEETVIDLVSGAYLYCLLFKPETITAADEWLEQVLKLIQSGVENGRER
ncbi:TetR/AcrR family transcriptional regulator [Paenibacillus kobensis]|uniref:TetR/AcrR family transcriptional regulator n=1 Tax=Paenibacillus kobensis TaxID=59841 RepID=UPI000FDA08A1|nr:TetR/AcrR family transcriptional regulator [Paenibacillus kobensis]